MILITKKLTRAMIIAGIISVSILGCSERTTGYDPHDVGSVRLSNLPVEVENQLRPEKFAEADADQMEKISKAIETDTPLDGIRPVYNSVDDCKKDFNDLCEENVGTSPVQSTTTPSTTTSSHSHPVFVGPILYPLPSGNHYAVTPSGGSHVVSNIRPSSTASFQAKPSTLFGPSSPFGGTSKYGMASSGLARMNMTASASTAVSSARSAASISRGGFASSGSRGGSVGSAGG